MPSELFRNIASLRASISGWVGLGLMPGREHYHIVPAGSHQSLYETLQLMEASARAYKRWTIVSGTWVPDSSIALHNDYALAFTDDTDAVHVRLLAQ